MVCCDQVPSLGLGDRRQIILPGLWCEATEPSRATSRLTKLPGTGAMRLPDRTTSVHYIRAISECRYFLIVVT